MQQSITSNLPKFILNGVRDLSTVTPLAQPENTPIHLPWFYLQTPKGDDSDAILIMSENDLTRLYGDAAVDPRKPYYNHATAFVQAILAQGNSCFIKRITRPTSTSVDQNGVVTSVNAPAVSNLVCMVEVDTTTTIYQYARDASGNVILNSNGAPTFDTTSPIEGGITLTFHMVDQGSLTDQQLQSPLVASTTSITGVLTAGSSVVSGINSTASLSVGMTVVSSLFPSNTKIQSVDSSTQITLTGDSSANLSNANLTFNGNQLLPIFKIQAPHVGIDGDNYGIKLWTAVSTAPYAGDVDVIADQGALIFNAQLLDLTSNGTPSVIPSLFSETVVNFCFKPNAYNYKTNQDLTINTLVSDWSDDGISTASSPTYGPLGSVDVFYSNLETLLDQLLEVENNIAPDPVSNIWMLDFLTGINENGQQHYGFQINTNGAVLGYNSSFFMLAGNDGDLTNETFESQIVYEINNKYNDPTHPFVNMALYPFSNIYDSGFTIPTKKELCKWLGYRKNVRVGLGTYVAGEAELTPAEEISVATDLISTVQTYAESEVWGTPAYRANILMQSGIPNNSAYVGRLSTLYELAVKRAIYMGAGSGIMKQGSNYTISPLNQLTLMKQISAPTMSDIADQAAWNAGATFSIPFSRRAQFWPMIQTVYPNNTSVLTGDVLQGILCDVQLKSAQVWAMLSGRADLTEAQFIKKSNALMTQLTNGIYDNQVTIVPNTYFTAADSARGYSWVMDVSVYGNVAKTVGQINVITMRQVSA